MRSTDPAPTPIGKTQMTSRVDDQVRPDGLTFTGTGGDALVRQLVLEGVDQIFGVPGVQLDWAVDAVVRDGRISFLHTRHEQGASYMADGYARSTGRVGVCAVVPGPGVLNAGAGLATAYACSAPVLCLAGQIPTTAIDAGLGLLHEIPNQTGVLSSLTKWSAMARAAGEIPALVREAVHQLRSGRPRPVALELPPDVLEETGVVHLVDPDAQPDLPLPPDPGELERAAALLARAERPVIWAGGGVTAANADPELLRLATALGAPVVMTNNGRGALDARHPLALTALAGRAVLPHADAVLAVGTRFVDGLGGAIAVPASASTILLNAEPNDLDGPRRCDVPLLADARLGLAGLADLIDTAHPAAAWKETELDAVRAWAQGQVDALGVDGEWVSSLRAAIPDDGVLVSELTQVGLYCEVAYPVYAPRTFLTSGYQGTLGYGFPTALGVAAADRDRAAVSITGDGGFGWGMSELATAAAHDIPLVTVVFADGAFGNVRRIQKNRFEGRVAFSDLHNPDFVALASSFDIDATRAESPRALQAALAEGLEQRRPALIEVPVGEFVSPWHLLHGFVPPPVPAPANPLGE